MFILGLFLLAFVPMIAEAVRSAANERGLRAAGAIEPADDVYAAMQIAYPACFLAMLAEGVWRGSSVNATAFIGATVFVLAKGLKYWCIATLGGRWTFRVLVPPGSQLTRSGPYRLVRHPNYIGVAGELVGFGTLAQAPVAAIVSLIVFGVLLVARIRVEERALGLRSG
jgi:methyltransferase